VADVRDAAAGLPPAIFYPARPATAYVTHLPPTGWHGLSVSAGQTAQDAQRHEQSRYGIETAIAADARPN
jgi:hypothetical protein